MKITKKSVIGKVIQKYPKTARIFLKYGMACTGCPVAASESIERACLAHGIDIVKGKKLLAELNKIAESASKAKRR